MIVEIFLSKAFSYKKVIVTGGSGFLGKNLKSEKSDWIYLSSKDCDLKDANQVFSLFMDERPDAVVHLAGRVGGIRENAENQAGFFHENTLINTNVIHEAHRANIDRVLSSLSTCAFPDISEPYPFSEEAIFNGPPASTNFSYGMTKRMLHVASISYRKQYNRNYSTFSPSNIYGPHDYFNSEASHFVPSLVSKVVKAHSGDTLEFWGTGTPRRQQLFVEDLTKIIPLLLESHHSSCPLIVAPYENLTIEEMIKISLQLLKKDVNITFNHKLDGQFRKDGSNKALLRLLGDFEFTSFREGLSKTIEWYKENI